jgi:predicted glycogen debranching enzyme
MVLPSIIFDKQKLSDFDQAIRNEWLVTNGLGGYGSSTTIALNTRKYHALLVASLRPPGERTVVLSKLDEDLSTGNKTYQLGSNDFKNDIYPKGFTLLSEFSLSPFPKYVYSAEECLGFAPQLPF